MEYRIGMNYAYLPNKDVIEIGKSNDVYTRLTDQELIDANSDFLTHEFIHSLLYKEFNLTVSKLFDTIGHLLFVYGDLFQKVLRNPDVDLTWKQFIDRDGIAAFYDNYYICTTDIETATIVCGGK